MAMNIPLIRHVQAQYCIDIHGKASYTTCVDRYNVVKYYATGIQLARRSNTAQTRPCK